MGNVLATSQVAVAVQANVLRRTTTTSTATAAASSLALVPLEARDRRQTRRVERAGAFHDGGRQRNTGALALATELLFFGGMRRLALGACAALLCACGGLVESPG